MSKQIDKNIIYSSYRYPKELRNLLRIHNKWFREHNESTYDFDEQPLNYTQSAWFKRCNDILFNDIMLDKFEQPINVLRCLYHHCSSYDFPINGNVPNIAKFHASMLGHIPVTIIKFQIGNQNDKPWAFVFSFKHDSTTYYGCFCAWCGEKGFEHNGSIMYTLSFDKVTCMALYNDIIFIQYQEVCELFDISDNICDESLKTKIISQDKDNVILTYMFSSSYSKFMQKQYKQI